MTRFGPAAGLQLRSGCVRAATAAVLAATTLTACQPGVGDLAHGTAGSPKVSADAAAASSALRQLAGLAVRPRVALKGYSRAAFGPTWPVLHGCDARNRVLARDMSHVVLRRGNCLVQSGTLVSPYSGQVIRFRRGPATSDLVEVDHVVALANAAMTGAMAWTEGQREAFANDPLELLAVDRASNQAKGDRDASGYLPPRRQEDCAYVERQVTIKRKYRLWITSAERRAMVATLKACP